MEKWECAYKENKFSINTERPSQLVSGIANQLKENSHVLDLGCGGGRNSIFLAKLGHNVEAVDIADLEFKNRIPEDIQERISFSKESVLKKFKPESYDLIIATRLFQYLSKDEMQLLIKTLSIALLPGGKLIANYTVSGGIFEEKGIEVEKFSHPINDIETILKENRFEKIEIRPGEGVTKHVPYDRPVEVYNIIASQPSR